MRVRIDLESDALYIRFSESPIAESEKVKEGVIVDFDADGHLVGLEVLNFTPHFGCHDLGGNSDRSAHRRKVKQSNKGGRKRWRKCRCFR